MGKIRIAKLGDESFEKKQRVKAKKRRDTKREKKQKVEGVGLKGGERTAVVEGTEIKKEFKELIKQDASQSEDEQAKKKKFKKVQKKIRSKRYNELKSLFNKKKLYTLREAVKIVKKTSNTKFDGTVEIHLSLRPNTGKKEKSDIRGTVSLPHGTGREIKVAIADEAVIEQVEKGKINFDVLVAEPKFMPKLAKVARILGPKGLMPNPKNGTVTENPKRKAEELSKGQVNFKSEPNNPLIHLGIGKVSFDEKKLIENINAVIKEVGENKVTKATIASTMGPGIKIDISSV